MFLRFIVALSCCGLGHCHSAFVSILTAPLFASLSLAAPSAISEPNSDVQCLLQEGWSVKTVSSVDAAGTATAAEPEVSDFGALLQVQTVQRAAPRMHADVAALENSGVVTAEMSKPEADISAHEASANPTDSVTPHADIAALESSGMVTAETSTEEAEITLLETSPNLTGSVALHADVAALESSGVVTAEISTQGAEITSLETSSNLTSAAALHADVAALESSGVAAEVSTQEAKVTSLETSTNLMAAVASDADVASPESLVAASHMDVGDIGHATVSASGDGKDDSALLQNFASVKRPPAHPEALPPADAVADPAASVSQPAPPISVPDPSEISVASVVLSYTPPRLRDSQAILPFLLATYPAIVLISAVGGSALLGACLVQEGQLSRGCGGPSKVPPSRLAPFSKRLYNIWSLFCALLPAQVVIGTPLIFVLLRWQWPEETFLAFLALAAAWILSNITYLAVFGGRSLVRIHQRMEKAFLDSSTGVSVEELSQVTHWVLLPNHQEDLSKLTATVESVLRSAVAGTRMGLVLAMEEREASTIFGKAKADQLRDRYASKFREFHLCLRPKSMQGSSPGRANNVSWAFEWLLEHLACTNQDTSRALLTVVSPGDEVHEHYFQRLAEAYLLESTETRTLTLWQSPVFRFKGYHQQPAPVAVASALDAVSSLAAAQPKSTYSLSLSLARRVGGWDPEVASEDAHMGAKCFLLTRGLARVCPLDLPTLRATPKGLAALWAERRRRATGSGDVAGYYFATLPLVCAHEGTSFSDAVRVWLGGIPYLAQLMNSHVLPGALAAVGLMEVLRPQGLLGSQQGPAGDDSSKILAGVCLFGSLAFGACASACLAVAYGLLRKRLWEDERRAGGDARKERSWDGLHAFVFTRWVYCFFRIFVLGTFCFVVLGAASWAAAAETIAGRAWELRRARAKQRPQRSPAAELYAASQELLDATPPGGCAQR